MSAEIRPLWCLIENQLELQPFSVQLDVDANIEDLKKEARKEKRKEFGGTTLHSPFEGECII